MSGLAGIRPSLFCNICERCWPNRPDYVVCPACREPTEDVTRVPLPEHEAQQIAAHFRFGWWLWDNDRV